MRMSSRQARLGLAMKPYTRAEAYLDRIANPPVAQLAALHGCRVLWCQGFELSSAQTSTCCSQPMGCFFAVVIATGGNWRGSTIQKSTKWSSGRCLSPLAASVGRVKLD